MLNNLLEKLCKPLLAEYLERGKRLGYEDGLRDGRLAQEAVDKELVEKKVIDRFAEMYQTVNPNNIVYPSASGNLFVNREVLTAIEVNALKEEAEYFKNTRLYRIFNETVRDQAIKKAILNSTDWEQVLSGKMMLHNLSVLRWLIERIEKAPLQK